LEVVVAFVGFFLAFLVVRMSWFRSVFECSPKLVALFGSVVALSKSLKPAEVFFELSFAGRWIAVTVLSSLHLRLEP
jgi:hypothetical protein